jgi:hypothetical protein
VGGQRPHLALLEVDVLDPAGQLPDDVLHGPARGEDDHEVAGSALDPALREAERLMAREVEVRPAGLAHAVGEVAVDLVQRDTTAVEQAVQVGALRHAPAMVRLLGQRVALHDRYAIEVVAEDARGGQPRDARADDDGMVSSNRQGSPVTPGGREIRSELN